MTYYKFLTAKNKGEYSGFDFTPYFPHDGKPGKWLPKRENIELCECGWHGFETKNVLEWINANLYEVEFKGDIITGDNKVVAQQMRLIREVDTWNDKTARLFACRCARDVLPLFEAQYPDDRRPRNAIEVAEKYANGEATADELYSAMDAAMDAARAAARAAAMDAAWAARAAAWAAMDAAWDAAWAAAWAAMDAAWAAAMDAAMDAARAAARAAAMDAAWAAARCKYSGWLAEMLGLEQEAK